MARNGTASDMVRAGNRRAVCPAPAKQIAETAARAARLAEISREYTMQVIVTDPAGREVLNLTKMTLKRDLYGKRNTTPDIQDVIALLVDAAREHLLPFD
jgi:hypothetical protein